MTALEARPGWQEHAACRGLDPNLFFPEREGPDNARTAKLVCAGCPVRAECLDFGLAETFGVWGGLSGLERRRARAQRQYQRRLRQPEPVNHGTTGGYKAHRRRGEPACPACKAAHVDYQRRRRVS